MVKCYHCSVKSSNMDEEQIWNEDIVSTVRKYALQNSLEYGGIGEAGSTLGRLLSEREELRAVARELRDLVEDEVRIANNLAENEGLDKVRSELEKFAPEALHREKHSKIQGLKELPGDTSNVVLRFAPNPNGPLSLGHSRGVIINSEYAKMYNGKVVLRFDDTDTKIKPPLPEAYDWIKEEYEWLTGGPPDVTIRASERMPIYLEYASKMIAEGHGYVCRCEVESFREFRKSKEECPCRTRESSENISDWESMIEGEIEEGEAVVRVKTDMTLPNPALRDWPALRIQHSPHPIVGRKYKVWPLLDFQSAIEDHEQGITHIIRGKDLMDSTRKQTILYQHFGWTYPHSLYWGRVKVHEYGGFSTSKMRESIESGSHGGWDDSRLPTIKALQRRGFVPESLREFWIDLGLTQKDVSIPLKTVETFNARKIDRTSERRSFVADPVNLKICGIGATTEVRLPKHPDNPEIGRRVWEVGNTIAIQKSDMRIGSARLKDFADVTVADSQATFESFERRDARQIIHWVPVNGAREAKLVAPNGDEINEVDGLLEDFELEVGKVYQLERIGFAKLESMKGTRALLLWLHK